MDHKLAESLQSLEKYTLNEMSAAERMQFEEHLFDCPICAEQVRQNFTIVENLKEVLREEGALATVSDAAASRSNWKKWFQFPSLVPGLVALALACVVIFQNTAGSNEMERVLMPASVLAPASRGESDVIRIDRKHPSFLLSFTVDAARPDSFRCEFDDASGNKVTTLESGPESTASFNLQVQLLSKHFPSGKYEMRLRPASEPDSITTYHFVIDDAK